MTYSPYDQNLDAFGRLRVAGTGQRLDVEFKYGLQDEFFDEVVSGGSASVTHNATPQDVTMTVGSTTNGESAKMSSHPVPYTPGNSQLIDITGVLDLAGISGGTAEVFLRSSHTGSIVEETIEQSSWTTNTDGINWGFSHIFSIDFQSLNVGSIRFFMVQNGVANEVAQINNDNEKDSGYWQDPNLPALYRIYNTATETIMEMGYGDEDNAIGFRYRIAANSSATMKAICCTVKSEGGLDLDKLKGLPRLVDTGITTKTVSTTLIPIISIRPKSTFNSIKNLIIALPNSAYIQADESVRFVVLHNSILTNASWSDVNTSESMMEYDIAATAFSNGHEIYADYLFASSSGAKGSAQTGAGGASNILGKTVLWDRLGDETGILTVAAVRSDTTDSEVLAGFRWEEIR